MGIVAAIICGPSVLLSSDCCPFGFYSETSHVASKCPSYDPASAFPGMAEPSDPSSQLGAGDDEAATTQEESNKKPPPESPQKQKRAEEQRENREPNQGAEVLRTCNATKGEEKAIQELSQVW